MSTPICVSLTEYHKTTLKLLFYVGFTNDVTDCALLASYLLELIIIGDVFCVP